MPAKGTRKKNEGVKACGIRRNSIKQVGVDRETEGTRDGRTRRGGREREGGKGRGKKEREKEKGERGKKGGREKKEWWVKRQLSLPVGLL